MIHDGIPKIAGRAAVHCDGLLKRRPTPDDLAPEFELLGERLALALRRTIAQAWGNPAVQVRSCGVRALVAGELKEICARPAAISVHAFGQAHRLVMAIEGRALLEQLDRAFGGSGSIGDDLPVELPVSANLLAKRIEPQIVDSLSSELGGAEFRADQRGGDLTQIRDYAADADMTVLTFEVDECGERPWQLVLTAETEHFSALLPRRSAGKSTPARRKPTMREAPFSDISLSAHATLVDMTVPLHRLAGLAPGAVLPIMIARNVPLQVGDTTIARGTVGQVDEQVALEITQIFSGKDSR
jgi:flagellar motor switch protein FliM